MFSLDHLHAHNPNASDHPDYDFFVSHNQSLVKWIHFFRGLIAIFAIIPNVLVICLFARASRRRTTRATVRTRINYAVVNLLITNILNCTILCVYSFLKRYASQSLSRVDPCLTITWFAVFASFEPLWAMAMVALTRLIHFVGNARLDRLATTRRLIYVRMGIVLADMVAASVIIEDEADEATETHCNYQLMLDNSKRYLIYNSLLCIILCVLGVTNFVFRIILRQTALRQVHAAEKIQSAATTSPPPSLQISTVHQNNLNLQPKSSSSNSSTNNEIRVPSLIWQKPKLILIAIVVVALFLIPRIAFFCDSRPFWLVSTLCPVLMATVLPLAFLWTTKEYRQELSGLCSTCSGHNHNGGGSTSSSENVIVAKV